MDALPVARLRHPEATKKLHKPNAYGHAYRHAEPAVTEQSGAAISFENDDFVTVLIGDQ
jgi:hypothetical protein